MTSLFRSRMRRTVEALVTLALVASAARTVSAQPWTSVGSAGTVDEADAGVVGFSLSEVTVRGTAPEAVVIRYNVIPVPGVVVGNSVILAARYRDSGAGSRITLILRGKSINNNANTTIATLNSDAFPQNVNPQTRSVLVCGPTLDFENNAYYIEAIVSRSTAGALLGLSNLKLFTGFFCEG